MAAAIPAIALAVTAASTGYQIYQSEEAKDQANKAARDQALAMEQAEKEKKEKEKAALNQFAMSANRAKEEATRRPAYMNMFTDSMIGSGKGKRTLIGG